MGGAISSSRSDHGPVVHPEKVFVKDKDEQNKEARVIVIRPSNATRPIFKGWTPCDKNNSHSTLVLQTFLPEPESKSRDFYSWLRWSPSPGSPLFDQLHKHFPGAIPDQAILPRIKRITENEKINIFPGNTIFGSSVCPDEINNTKGGVIANLKSYFGQCFPIGGLGGAPTTGKTGFAAFSNHVPENGNVFILFAPHVAISEDGQVGKILRQGQSHVTTSCGAVCGAYECCRGRQVGEHEEFDSSDFQMHWLKQKLEPHVNNIAKSEEPMASLAYQAYELVKEQINKVVDMNFTMDGKLILFGGIQINMPGGYDDHFLPLMFDVRHKDASSRRVSLDCLEKFKETLELREGDLYLSNNDDPSNMTCFDTNFARLEWGPEVDSPCREALRRNFRHAMPGKVLCSRVLEFLRNEYDLVSSNTHFATSLCPDEINSRIGGLTELMKDYFGDLFELGGISGAPFAGKTGFKAYVQHIPDNGNVVILFGPHVGVSSDGKVGSVHRVGQTSHSSACGATIGAYNALLCQPCGEDMNIRASCHFDPNDFQMDWIKSQIAPHRERIVQSSNPMSALAYQTYKMVRDKLETVIDMTVCQGNVVLIGGIQINLPDSMDDYFQPMMFEVRKHGETTRTHMDVFHRPVPFQEQLTTVG